MSITAASPSTDQALPSFYYGSRTKPLLALESLFTAFRPASAPFELARESNYDFRPDHAEPGVIMLEEGIASICHGEKQMVVTPLFSPSILGFMDGYGLFDDIPQQRHYVLFAETDLHGRWISHQAAVDILNEQNLWRHVTHILAQRLMVLSMREQELMGVDSYLMVRTLLMELAGYPEAYRRKINVLNFILRRTNLSRSRIMSILSELRKGDYIMIHRGVLRTIAHPLPAHF
ncbi:winged helix-turn-helix transcriptional regulator [Klebsiella variicola]|uniref:winged helix-turn-helix transcriptional regulator n=1 Tax=Klebsiella variicola TaxID=244366 RepID=UPI001CDB1DDA|nr:winged helix-turn-helix transcriptional regulator [Klebsiella variicola]